MNKSLKQAAATLIQNSVYDKTILNKVEMAVRAYDPRMSCLRPDPPDKIRN